MNKNIQVSSQITGFILKSLFDLKGSFNDFKAKYQYNKETETHFILIENKDLFQDEIFLKRINRLIIIFEETYNEGLDFLDEDNIGIFKDNEDIIQVSNKGFVISDKIIGEMTNISIFDSFFNKPRSLEKDESEIKLGSGIATRVNKELSKIIDENFSQINNSKKWYVLIDPESLYSIEEKRKHDS